MSLVDYGYDSGEEDEILEVAKVPTEKDQEHSLYCFQGSSFSASIVYACSSSVSVTSRSNSSSYIARHGIANVDDSSKNADHTGSIDTNDNDNHNYTFNYGEGLINDGDDDHTNIYDSYKVQLGTSVSSFDSGTRFDCHYSNIRTSNVSENIFERQSCSSTSVLLSSTSSFFSSSAGISLLTSSNFLTSSSSVFHDSNNETSLLHTEESSTNSMSRISQNNYENLMPEVPNTVVDAQLQKHIEKLIEYQKNGKTINKNIQESLQFKNPYLLDKIMSIFRIDCYCSNFPVDKFDPNSFKNQNYYYSYDILAKKQLEISLKKKTKSPLIKESDDKNRKKRSRNRFLSKWDVKSSDYCLSETNNMKGILPNQASAVSSRMDTNKTSASFNGSSNNNNNAPIVSYGTSNNLSKNNMVNNCHTCNKGSNDSGYNLNCSLLEESNTNGSCYKSNESTSNIVGVSSVAHNSNESTKSIVNSINLNNNNVTVSSVSNSSRSHSNSQFSTTLEILREKLNRLKNANNTSVLDNNK